MHKLLKTGPVLTAFLLLWTFDVATASETSALEKSRGAENAFREAVVAWKEDRFEDLYDQGSRKSKQFVSKQEFVRLMKNSNIRLQCCWVTVQAVKGTAHSATDAYVTATLGYEIISPSEESVAGSSAGRWTATSSFKEDTFLFYSEEGSWRIDLSDVLAAGGYAFAYPPLSGEPQESHSTPSFNHR
jgi:hypothetical protein